jgi:murein DD-endopeptidase MepM/ murein hydrolase activator NlpD
MAEWLDVCREAYALRRTVGFSADDACVGDLDHRRAVFYGLTVPQRTEYAAWVQRHYPGVVYEFSELPEMGDTFWPETWPAVSRNITQRFGENVEFYLKQFGIAGGHNGVDFATPVGEPIVAVQGGIVQEAVFDADGYGLWVRIQHDDAHETRYAHLDRIASGIHQGVEVEPWRVIGYAGSTGMSTGPHLHFELRRNGRAIDPLPFLEELDPKR